MEGNISMGFAFFAGLASFLSPCVFALVPAYVSYLSGRSAAAGKEFEGNTWVTVTHGAAFVGGFSLVFILLGVLAGAVRSVFIDFTDILVKVGGVIVVIFGLHMLKIINIPFLNYDLRPQGKPDRQRGYLSSALMGVFFSAGWSACVGPILGAILTLSFAQGTTWEGVRLLTAYSAGLGIPFLLAATQIGWVTTILRRFNRVMHYTEMVMGTLMVILGGFLFTGRFATLARYGSFFGETVDEVAMGRLLMAAVVGAVVLGLIPGFVARRQGKNFMDWWFLGSGFSLILLVLLYLFGALNFVTPLIS